MTAPVEGPPRAAQATERRDGLVLTPRYQRIIAALVLVAGAFFIVMGASTFWHGRALATRGVVVDAEITGATQREGDSDTGHQVRYRFRVGDREYQRVGVFGTPVGADVTAEAQAEAITSGHVAVRYLLEDPAVNEPVAHSRPQGERGAIAMGIGLLMLLAGLVRLGLARTFERQTTNGIQSRSDDAP
jgi:hypothetical protein